MAPSVLGAHRLGRKPGGELGHEVERADAGLFGAALRREEIERADAGFFGEQLKREEVERADAGLFGAALKREEVERADAGFFNALDKKEQVEREDAGFFNSALKRESDLFGAGGKKGRDLEKRGKTLQCFTLLLTDEDEQNRATTLSCLELKNEGRAATDLLLRSGVHRIHAGKSTRVDIVKSM